MHKKTREIKKNSWENWYKINKETNPEIHATIKSKNDTVIAPDLKEESPANCK